MRNEVVIVWASGAPLNLVGFSMKSLIMSDVEFNFEG